MYPTSTVCLAIGFAVQCSSLHYDLSVPRDTDTSWSCFGNDWTGRHRQIVGMNLLEISNYMCQFERTVPMSEEPYDGLVPQKTSHYTVRTMCSIYSVSTASERSYSHSRCHRGVVSSSANLVKLSVSSRQMLNALLSLPDRSYT